MSSVGLFFTTLALLNGRVAAMHIFKSYSTPLYRHWTLRMAFVVLLVEVLVYLVLRAVLYITIRRYKKKIGNAMSQAVLDESIYFSGAPDYNAVGLFRSLLN
ncbi:hypothetical protein QR680_008656 [Steinernema hermaphroditum]|uniref:ABC transmembrane type-1 domain-containing protein n=1 Tax=Steinernema hermaphroditum TaxID=289476 RepID=A0AA39M8G9_9BILA|nr:hypothetical protein QR680_008656 [Steinernema hermaphroditum]